MSQVEVTLPTAPPLLLLIFRFFLILATAGGSNVKGSCSTSIEWFICTYVVYKLSQVCLYMFIEDNYEDLSLSVILIYFVP